MTLGYVKHLTGIIENIRDYQLDELNWKIRLYNGILVDEMLCKMIFILIIGSKFTQHT